MCVGMRLCRYESRYIWVCVGTSVGVWSRYLGMWSVCMFCVCVNVWVYVFGYICAIVCDHTARDIVSVCILVYLFIM